MMARPSLIRADTIDLQGADAPQAATHTKQINGDSIAPHQASQNQLVEDERHAEEQNLADAWAMSANGDNEVTVSRQDQDEDKIGQDSAEGGADGVEEDDGDQDADDDLMDRISSSPSIDDGKHHPYHATSTKSTTDAEVSNMPQQKYSLPRSGRFVLKRNKDGSSEWLLDRPPKEATGSYRPSEFASALAKIDLAALTPTQYTHHERDGRYLLDEAAIEQSASEDATPIPYMHNTSQYTRLNNAPGISRASTIARPSGYGHLPRTTSHASLLDLHLEDLLLPEHDPMLRPIDELSPTDSWEEIFGDDGIDDSYPYDDVPPLPHMNSFLQSDRGRRYLQYLEDIDFEFVYALHTFVATVEGQANATKGDTMVLLDDSNSYWWLVRVVKDSSIGYLPAEHIETPTERLARLNKHRNIDLSQSMLGDNPEKTRNPLKMAMRRRNAKTVQFAAPTYVEASDYDYSDDEDNIGNDSFIAGAPVDDPAVNGQPAEVEERNAPEEANVHATRRYSGDQASIASRNSFDSSHKASFDGGIIDDPQLSPKLVDRSEAAPLKSRKGTPRNTDSFLKDDSIETRKITLTPGLLREDGNNGSKSSSIDSQRNPSMESLTKVTSPPDSASTASSKKDSKDKKKDKQKGGMLSGLFKSKKKDKKGGKGDDASEERPSLEVVRGPSPRFNGSSSPVDRSSNNVVAAALPVSREMHVQSRATNISAPVQPTNNASPPPGGGQMLAELQGSEAAHEMAGTVPDQPTNKDIVSSQAQRAKQQHELDDFDSPQDQQNPFSDPDDKDDARMMSPSGTITDGADFVHIPTSFNDDDFEESTTHEAVGHGPPKQSAESQRTTTDDDTDLFADARERTLSPATKRGDVNEPTLVQSAPSEAPIRGNSTSSQSTSGEAETPKSASVVSHDSKNAWDDGALRAWLDADEVKDMLTIVHSSAHANGPIQPVSDDHPLMRGLYAEETTSLTRMMTELDALMMDFATRKGYA